MQILSVPHSGISGVQYLVVAGGGGGGAGGNGASPNKTGGSGGSGIVIIDAGILAASTTGSPSVSGTIYTFTGSGTITF